MGRKVAQILEHHYTAGNKCMETLGLTDVPVDLLRVANEVRQSLATSFGATLTETGPQAEIIAAMALLHKLKGVCYYVRVTW